MILANVANGGMNKVKEIMREIEREEKIRAWPCIVDFYRFGQNVHGCQYFQWYPRHSGAGHIDHHGDDSLGHYHDLIHRSLLSRLATPISLRMKALHPFLFSSFKSHDQQSPWLSSPHPWRWYVQVSNWWVSAFKSSSSRNFKNAASESSLNQRLYSATEALLLVSSQTNDVDDDNIPHIIENSAVYKKDSYTRSLLKNNLYEITLFRTTMLPQ